MEFTNHNIFNQRTGEGKAKKDMDAVNGPGTRDILLCLAPFMPHNAEEYWGESRRKRQHSSCRGFRNLTGIRFRRIGWCWCFSSTVKVRSKLTLPAGMTDDKVKEAAMNDPKKRKRSRKER